MFFCERKVPDAKNAKVPAERRRHMTMAILVCVENFQFQKKERESKESVKNCGAKSFAP